MNIDIRKFDPDRVEEAAQLLMSTQRLFSNAFGEDIFLHEMQCLGIVREELAKNVSTALMVLHEEKLVGYMIAVVKEDAFWGDSGWVNIGGWAISPAFDLCLPLLYKGVAEDWVARRILTHYIMVFHEDKESRNLLHDLSFAKEQTHAILPLDKLDLQNPPGSQATLELRKAEEKDRESIKSLSRVIAEYQTLSPCFASAPPPYLKVLDKGFSDLLDDDEAEIYLALDKGNAVGIEVFYEENRHLLIPGHAAELSIGAVDGNRRGQGIGRELTRFSLQDQQRKGRKYIAADWRCANLLSSRFWPKIGFQPLAHRYIRRIDPQILKSENEQ